MRECASYVPLNARKWRRVGVVVSVVSVVGAVGAIVADAPWAGPLVALAVALLLVIGGVLASSTTRYVILAGEALHVDEHRWITRTRRSTIRLDRAKPAMTSDASTIVIEE